MPLLLQRMNISQFRCYEAVRLDLSESNSGSARMVVLTGPNGAGKTNILEAVSLLVPGKGLRGADALDMKNRAAGAEDLWTVAAEVETASGLSIRLGTGLSREQGKISSSRRLVRINGKDAKTQSELSGFISAVWLTPQMDGLFQAGPKDRRKFLDRLVFAYEPDHVTRLNRTEKTMRERMRLLQTGCAADPKWLSSLETQLAADAVSVAASRLALMQHLQAHIDLLEAPFPRPHLRMEGWIEQEISVRPAVDVEDELKAMFCVSRMIDAASSRTQHGIHRSDLQVTYADKNMPASRCSTGEQKALLVSIVLAHALMMQAEKGFVPLILLDEVAAHLDRARREQLFAQLSGLNGQVWLTGTDAGIFSSLPAKTRRFAVDEGRVIS